MMEFKDVPSLEKLLKRTFERRCVCYQGEDIQDKDCPQFGKKVKRSKEEEEDTLLPGISREELRDEPLVEVALRKLVQTLSLTCKEELCLFENNEKSEKFQPQPGCSRQEKINEALQEVEQLVNYTWEQLNIGHWKSVPRLWRKLYTCLSILKVSFMLLEEDTSNIKCIKECDMGLLMGEPICNNVLSQIAEEINEAILTQINDSDNAELDIENVCLLNEKLCLLKNKSEHEFNVEVSDNPSLEEFLSYMKCETPALLRNIVDHWPAMGKWSVAYIQKIAGFRTVPVELGQKYTSEDWTQKVMTLNEFINKYLVSSTESTSTQNGIGYVAQHHLFDQLPQLRKDIKIPDYCTFGTSKDSVEINAWFGPANTISPTHYDPKHNILVQVFGSKIIRLFPPSESEILRPYQETSLLFNTSQLDVEQNDLFDTNPAMKKVKHCDILLNAGESLYIPPKWWHYVKSLEPSFSVSFWFE